MDLKMAFFLALFFFFVIMGIVGFLTEAQVRYLTALFSLVGSVITINGILATQKKRKTRIRKAESRPTPVTGATAPQMPPSFESGLYGGLLGGALAGLIIGGLYYLHAKPQSPGIPWSIIPGIILYAAIFGTTLGGLSQAVMHLFRYLAVSKDYPTVAFNEVSGGILGGLIAGPVLGAIGGWWFGTLPYPPYPAPEVGALIVGGVVGPIPIVLGSLFYDYQGRLRKAMRALLLSLILVPFLFILGVLGIMAIGVEAEWFNKMDTVFLAIEGGAILGLLIGFLAGLQIGLTLRLYRLWAAISEPAA